MEDRLAVGQLGRAGVTWPAFCRRRSAAHEQTGGDAESVMTGAGTERQLIAGFDVPADVLLRPEHEIEHAAQAPECPAVTAGRMNQLRSRADHEFELR